MSGMHFLSDRAFELGFPIAIFLMLWLFAWLRLRPQWFRMLRSLNWPVVLGTIEDGTVSVVRSGKGEVAIGRLNYSYQVNGSYYGGSRLHQFSDEQAAYNYINEKSGQSAEVRHNPAKPDDSVLANPT